MTLPTRADGWIDWGKLEAATPIMISSAAMRVLGEQIAAYERERCAKWHDIRATEIRARAKRCDADGLDTSEFEELASNHEAYAAAIRKMED